MLRQITFGLAGALVLAAAPVSADEVWRNGTQTITYEADLEGTDIAVLRHNNSLLYVSGLAGVYEDRGTYRGVWIADDDSKYSGFDCMVEIKRPGSDDTARVWGQVEVYFSQPDFPSTIAIVQGSCFRETEWAVIADPVLGGEE